MKRRLLGNTDLWVSELSLGTVQFGLPYGLPDKKGNLPIMDELEALKVLREAFRAGINFIDTARNYGTSEAVIARALKHAPDDVVLATKLAPLSPEMDHDILVKTAKASIEASRRTLDREVIDLLQIHNATPELMAREELLDVFDEARSKERIRFQGATTYGREAAEFAVAHGFWHTVQVEFNLLNQTLLPVLDEAEKNGVGVIVRSALMKGALVIDPEALPDNLKPLGDKIRQIPGLVENEPKQSLAQIALGFVLAHEAVSTVICGVMSTEQLEDNLSATTQAPWSAEQLEMARSLNLGESALTDPRQWGF